MKPIKGIELWNKAKKIIPGGSQLLSKRAELYLPDNWPAYFSKAEGAYVWDLDGNKYLDTASSIGASTLGYADPDVNQAVIKVVQEGNTSTLNAPEEVELAELLIKLHPWAQMVRYARGGGEGMAVAVRIARAYSGKDKVAFCGYHGWPDWYLAANLADDKNLDGHLLPGLEPKGVPRGLKGTAIPFHYNKIEELEKIVAENDDLGAIAMEPIRDKEPKDNFLQKVRKIADDIKVPLIIDEVTMGWRLAFGGAHLKYGVNPDIAVFAKGTSNGYPMAAIIGIKEVMQAAQTTFISSSYWTEKIGPAAALATIRKMIKINLPEHLDKIGGLFEAGLNKLADKHGIKLKVTGLKPMILLGFDYGDDSQAVRTFYTQEMLKRGIIATGGLDVNYAMKEKQVEEYLKAADETLSKMKLVLAEGKLKDLLEGPIAHAKFKRLT